MPANIEIKTYAIFNLPSYLFRQNIVQILIMMAPMKELIEKADNSPYIMKCTPNIGRISICLDGMSSVLYRAHVV